MKKNEEEKKILSDEKSPLFFEEKLKFEVLDGIEKILINNFSKFDITILDQSKEIETLLMELVEKVTKIFEKTNQYISFKDEDKKLLEEIYMELLLKIQEQYSDNREDIDRIVKNLLKEHFDNLKIFLEKTNGSDLFELYRDRNNTPVVICEEYTAELQINILGLDIENLKEPILDIGCGQDYKLVKYLREKGYNAYGLDRIESKEDFIINCNWLEYKFERNSWGTIISHMAFSNHFSHHHMRKDGKYVEFMKKYIEIANALVVKGEFIYAPQINFIEKIMEKSSNDFHLQWNKFSTKVIKKSKV